jgi:hypothetical protein
MQFISRNVFRDSHSTLRLSTLLTEFLLIPTSALIFADALVLQPDICHPPVVIEIPLAFHNNNQTPNYEYLLL